MKILLANSLSHKKKMKLLTNLRKKKTRKLMKNLEIKLKFQKLNKAGMNGQESELTILSLEKSRKRLRSINN